MTRDLPPQPPALPETVMPAAQLANTIDQIYGLDEQQKSWVSLAESMLDLLGIERADAQSPCARQIQEQLTTYLTPHLERALRLQQQQYASDHLQNLKDLLIARHPLAMAILDEHGVCLYANPAMQKLLHHLPQEQYQSLMHRASDQVFSLEFESHGLTCRLLRLPLTGADAQQRSILVSHGNDPLILDQQLLRQMFQLTEAEARVATAIAQGQSTEMIAQENGTSVETVRSQTKKVMQKTGVHRQGELVARLLSSPAALQLPARADSQQQDCLYAQVQGQQLAYSDYGPADGYPVFFIHSWAGCHLQQPPDHTALQVHKLRLITPDRPGMGYTESVLLTPQEWAQQCLALADVLHIREFAVVAYSLGAAFALALATAGGARISQIQLVCPVAPVRSLSDLQGMTSSGKLLFTLTAQAPALASLMVRLWMGKMRAQPWLYLDSVRHQLAPRDAITMCSPWIRDHYTRAFACAIRQGNAGLLHELKIMAGDWLSNTAVRQPVTIWHGEEDSHIPLSLCKKLAAHLPQAQWQILPHCGHYLLYHHWPYILASLRRQLAPHADKHNALSD